ncbi:MAG: hypothetical protein LBN27_09100 [Prevotellaceae bacterium]|jgi:hypothetical protein|nr:hypothetical protein [Prevotellaceae bacterium]
MKKTDWNKIYPYLIAIVLFTVLSWLYFSPAMEGKVVEAHDTKTFLGMSQEIRDFQEKTGEHTYWTNSMFGGMPSYQISGASNTTVVSVLNSVLNYFPRPVSFAFLYLLGGFLLLLAFGVKPYLSIIGSIVFAFASYNFIIIAAGHATKAITIAYIMPLIGSIVLAYNGKRLLGALLTAVFLGLAIGSNHLQILYYAMFIVGIFFVAELIYVIINKKILDFLKTTGVLIIAALLAAAVNAPMLMTTYEYTKYTMRGDSNGLTTVVDNQSAQHGLNTDYITQWSYDIDETMTLLIPDFKGGASGGTLSADSHTGQKLREMGVRDVESTMADFQLPLYWGTQPVTSGPVYFGAAVILLFVLGLFVVKGRYKWWLLAATVLSILLAWGKNFLPFTEFFINYVPMYNKFRTVAMTLVIAGISMPLLGILALKNIFSGEIDKEKTLKYLLYSTSIVGGICLLFWWFPSLAGNFVGASDAQFSGQYEFLKITLPLDRKDMLSSDAFRSLALVLLTAATLYFTIKGKLKNGFAIAILGVLFLFDLWQVDKRYLNDKNFTDKEMLSQPYTPTNADRMILQDKSPDYRVLNLSVSTFNDSGTSYFHKSIGGYHGAKLRRYQELINAHLQNEMMGFSRVRTEKDLDSVLQQSGVLNMLNTKYIIFSNDFAPVNPYANGNAWLVNKTHIAQNADEEMMLLGKIDTKKELVADKEFEKQIIAITPDSAAHIELLSYAPNDLKYHFTSKSDQIAVFSEIYYPDWNVYIDGKKADNFRANYLLRAMPLKAGDYDIEWRFEPGVVSTSRAIAMVASILLLLFAAGIIYIQTQDNRHKTQDDRHKNQDTRTKTEDKNKKTQVKK